MWSLQHHSYRVCPHGRSQRPDISVPVIPSSSVSEVSVLCGESTVDVQNLLIAGTRTHRESCSRNVDLRHVELSISECQ